MTEIAETLWDMEKRFWLDGADFYEAALSDGAVMVFPYPVGILDRAGVMAGLGTGPRWQSVEMEECSLVRRGNTAVLAYRATAWHRGAEPQHGDGAATDPHVALCASTYIEDGDGWLMMAHTQQPLGVAADATKDA